MPSSSDSTMVKKGTKCKIEIEKRMTKQQRSVACSKRRRTVFSKAADLCRFGGANIGVFVTSPAENSDTVYSFSGYTSASELAHCYLNGKQPPPIQHSSSDFDLGFCRNYASCYDLAELNMMEDRVLRMREEVMARIDKMEKTQNPSSSQYDPNPSRDADQVHQNPSSDQLPDLEMEEAARVLVCLFNEIVFMRRTKYVREKKKQDTEERPLDSPNRNREPFGFQEESQDEDEEEKEKRL